MLLSKDPSEVETEKLLKNVRSIFNKLTPENYQTLLAQFQNLKINTENQLISVIDLIFEKAVKEQTFVVQYAGFCSQLRNIKIDVHENDKVREVKFRSLLIKRCEMTFKNKMYADITDLEEKQRQIEECQDPVKKKELVDLLDDEKRKSRKRSIGNIKLIAEFFKLDMINAAIIYSCFSALISSHHEDYVECLCALITNIGEKVERDHFQPTFNETLAYLKRLYENENKKDKSLPEISSRVRFMILDLLELKKDNWVSRRKKDGPKTIAEVHEDLRSEARQKSLEISEFNKNRKKSSKSNGIFSSIKCSLLF